MDPLQLFKSQHPEVFVLEHRLSAELTEYLLQHHWLHEDESIVSVEKPGEGNMNFVARIVTDSRSFIVKQALPWVYKYPHVPAPPGRGKSEAIFYQLIEDDPVLQGFSPTLIGFDLQSQVLVLEDLGASADFTFLYGSSGTLEREELQNLLLFLSHLHRIKATPEEARCLHNRAMRELNHEHIFRYPYEENNGLDLDEVSPGLKAVARTFQKDTTLKQKITEVGNLYLQNGSTLVHGDFYPGSWLRGTSGIRVIDPEFGFFGSAEFDVGVMLAHALIVDRKPYTPQQILAGYQPPSYFSESLAWSYAGIEVMRRLLGLAQLPLSISLAEREALLRQAASLI